MQIMTKIKKTISKLSIIVLFSPIFCQVLINEYSASNLSWYTDNYQMEEDWIELYNTGSTEEDIGVVGLPAFLQRIQNAAHLGVEMLDDGIVFLTMHLHRMLRTRHGAKALIAQLVRITDLILIRILRQIVLRHLDTT